MKRTRLNTRCHQSRTFARVCDFRLLVNLLWNTELLDTSMPKVRGGQIRVTCKGHCALWNVSEQPDTHMSYIQSAAGWKLWTHTSPKSNDTCCIVLKSSSLYVCEYYIHTNTWVLHMAESLCELWLSKTSTIVWLFALKSTLIDAHPYQLLLYFSWIELELELFLVESVRELNIDFKSVLYLLGHERCWQPKVTFFFSLTDEFSGRNLGAKYSRN